MRFVELFIDLGQLAIRRSEAHQPCWLATFDRLNGVWVFEWVGWDMATTLLSYVALELLDASLLALNARFSLQGDSIVSV